MSDKIRLTAELRHDVGKGASRRLRRAGEKVPAIIYGAEKIPQTLSLAVNELTKAMEQEAFFSQIMDVVVEGDAQQAVVRDLQRNPASGKVMHIDFFRISADKAIEVHVPLHFVNEDKCVGVRLGGGNIAHNLTDVEVSCLPANLPEYIEVDMEHLEAGQSVHLSDLKLPEGVTIVALSYGEEDRDIPVVSVTLRRGGAQDEEEAGDEAADAAEEAGESEAQADDEGGDGEEARDD